MPSSATTNSSPTRRRRSSRKKKKNAKPPRRERLRSSRRWSGSRTRHDGVVIRERLAQELRALQPISPRQFHCLGDADADTGCDFGFFQRRIKREGGRIQWQPIVSFG